MCRAGTTGLAPSWPWLLALGLACVASVAPRCEGLGQGLGQHAAVHGQGSHLPRDRHAAAAAAPLQPPQPQQQADKKLHAKRSVSAALGPRLRRQLRFAEAPADEDDADEMGAAMAAERWLRHPGGGGGGPGGGSGGGMAAARALGLDDFPPPPPHPKHLLYNAVLPSLPLRKRSGLDAHSLGHHAGPYEEFGPSENMLRSTRGNRQYDVPQIECPPADDGMERFACPTPDHMGRYRCIDDHVLCDGFIDCPAGEDEDRQACMFYKTTKAHLDLLADALLRWARGR